MLIDQSFSSSDEVRPSKRVLSYLGAESCDYGNTKQVWVQRGEINYGASKKLPIWWIIGGLSKIARQLLLVFIAESMVSKLWHTWWRCHGILMYVVYWCIHSTLKPRAGFRIPLSPCTFVLQQKLLLSTQVYNATDDCIWYCQPHYDSVSKAA